MEYQCVCPLSSVHSFVNGVSIIMSVYQLITTVLCVIQYYVHYYTSTFVPHGSVYVQVQTVLAQYSTEPLLNVNN